MIDDTDDQWIALDDTSDCDLATPPPSPKEKDPMNSPRVLKAIADAVAKALDEKKEDKPLEPQPKPKTKRRVHTGL